MLTSSVACVCCLLLRDGLSQGGRGGRGGPGAYSGGRRRPPAYRPQRYDKDKFLQANFRFLVSCECSLDALSPPRIQQLTLVLWDEA
jgi:hypothetical protein